MFAELVRAELADLQPLVQYPWWVLVLGLAMMAGAVAWVVWVVLSTRARPLPQGGPPAPPDAASGARHAAAVDPYAAARAAHLARLDGVAHRYTAHELDERGVHLELAAVLRDFSSVRLGRPVGSLTAEELAALRGADRPADVLESFLRPAFGRGEPTRRSAESALDRVRTVIRTW